MKFRFRLLFCLSILPWPTLAQTSTSRPKITGVSHLAVYASDPLRTADYYQRIVGCDKVADFEDHPGVSYAFNPAQFVEVLPLPDSAGIDRLDHIAFRTGNAEALRKYMLAHSVPTPNPVKKSASGVRWFEVKDFEGNKVQFVEDPVAATAHSTASNPKLVGHHIIHVGMMIRDREAADQFYRDILGFHLYWHGGKDPGKTDWVAMQVPDGTDWLEYMMVTGPDGSPLPADINQKSLGVLNHLSVGVTSMAAAVARLKNENRIGPRGGPAQIGKDGKWQFNDYDPDGTRLEYMEFTPVNEPCCSPFTGTHPSPTGQ